MVHITNTYLGDLRCESTHGPSSATIHTDAPVDNNGKGEAFSPTDLVATALSTCIMTIMGIVAKKHDIDLKGLKIDAEKHMATEGIRRIAQIKLTITMPMSESDPKKELFINTVEKCPVHKSLHPDILTPVEWVWA